jgi:RNA polymerase sigma-70 factor, ECF subfamily
VPGTQATSMPVHVETVETDAFLLGLVRQGDAQAGEKLVLRYHEPLLRYLLRITGRLHLAEELHQQTWVSVLQHINQFNPASGGFGFKAWLFRIATNKANDLWRSNARQRTTIKHLTFISEDATPDADTLFTATEEDCRVRQAVARLPENQRQVLMLRYYSGLKFSEIADLLGCPLNTALGRMHKALEKMRDMLGNPDTDHAQPMHHQAVVSQSVVSDKVMQ